MHLLVYCINNFIQFVMLFLIILFFQDVNPRYGGAGRGGGEGGGGGGGYRQDNPFLDNTNNSNLDIKGKLSELLIIYFLRKET